MFFANGFLLLVLGGLSQLAAHEHTPEPSISRQGAFRLKKKSAPQCLVSASHFTSAARFGGEFTGRLVVFLLGFSGRWPALAKGTARARLFCTSSSAPRFGWINLEPGGEGRIAVGAGLLLGAI